MGLLVSVLILFAQAEGPEVAHVQFSQFQKGNYWHWMYSERDRKTNTWNPYFEERYTVIDISGNNITIEMTSGPAGDGLSGAHHKMVVDFAKCEKAAKDSRFRNFTVAFYTHSFGKGWQPVSMNHKNLVFTEKFNCAGPYGREKVAHQDLTLNGQTWTTFQKQPGHEASWYFLDLPGLSGVAASKDFEPKGDYKMEYMKHCDQGEACAVF